MTNKKILVAPSILAADAMNFGKEIERMAAAGADYVHFDVMDGRFVPNITFGLPVAKAAAKLSLPLDVHLMIVEPEKYIDKFALSGAKIITIHAEATNHLHRALQMIHATGCMAGVALNPSTSPEVLRYVADLIDVVLIMTVNPGAGGQKLIPACMNKVKDVRKLFDELGQDVIIEIDGGVNETTAVQLVENGATMLVAGSALFGAADAAKFIANVKALG